MSCWGSPRPENGIEVTAAGSSIGASPGRPGVGKSGAAVLGSLMPHRANVPWLETAEPLALLGPVNTEAADASVGSDPALESVTA